jgi:hypothetical protein
MRPHTTHWTRAGQLHVGTVADCAECALSQVRWDHEDRRGVPEPSRRTS